MKNVPQSSSIADRVVSIAVTQRKMGIYWIKIQYSQLYLLKHITNTHKNTNVPYLRPNLWPTVSKHDYSLARRDTMRTSQFQNVEFY